MTTEITPEIEDAILDALTCAAAGDLDRIERALDVIFNSGPTVAFGAACGWAEIVKARLKTPGVDSFTCLQTGDGSDITAMPNSAVLGPRIVACCCNDDDLTALALFAAATDADQIRAVLDVLGIAVAVLRVSS